MQKKAKVFDALVAKAQGTKEKLFLSAVQLFSDKGCDSVGIRELCASVGIKESSFYNHYASKEDLLNAIFAYWEDANRRAAVNDLELTAVALSRGPAAMVGFMMEHFAKVTDSPVVHAVLAIVRMEGYTNPKARPIALMSLYHYRKDSTIKALRALKEAGLSSDVDPEDWTAAYFYGLIGILDEYVLCELAAEDLKPIMNRIERHMAFFIRLLEPIKRR